MPTNNRFAPVKCRKSCCARCGDRTPSVYRVTFQWRREGESEFYFEGTYSLSKTTTDYDGTQLGAESCVWAVAFAPTDQDGAWCAEGNAIYLRLLDPVTNDGVAWLLEIVDTRTDPVTVLYRMVDGGNGSPTATCDQHIGMAWAFESAGPFAPGTCGNGSISQAAALDPIAYSCCPCPTTSTTSTDEPTDPPDQCSPQSMPCCAGDYPDFIDVDLSGSNWTNHQFSDANGNHDICVNCAQIADVYSLPRIHANGVCYWALCIAPWCQAADGYDMPSSLMLRVQRELCDPSPAFPNGSCRWTLRVEASASPANCWEEWGDGGPPITHGRTRVLWTGYCTDRLAPCTTAANSWMSTHVHVDDHPRRFPCYVQTAGPPTLTPVHL